MYQLLYGEVLQRERPLATARLIGSERYPLLRGRVAFYPVKKGVLVSAEVRGLPEGEGPCASKIFGFHIHEGGACTGNSSDPFADVMGHYNPKASTHPHHAGDMPPLFGNGGYAFSAFVTDRFLLKEIIGKTVIVHAMGDDFMTQPSGAAGEKIACGVIQLTRER